MKWVKNFARNTIAVFIYALLCAFVVFIDSDDSAYVDNDRCNVD